MKPELKRSRADLPFSNEAGFTLIEVIVALAILTIGVLAVNAMQTTAVKGNMTASDITIASTWAADKVEQIFGMDYEDDAVCHDEDDNPFYLIDYTADGTAGLDDMANEADSNRCGPDYSSPDGLYKIDWNVAEEFPMPNTKTVHVIVTNKVSGKSVTLKHIKSRYF